MEIRFHAVKMSQMLKSRSLIHVRGDVIETVVVRLLEKQKNALGYKVFTPSCDRWWNIFFYQLLLTSSQLAYKYNKHSAFSRDTIWLLKPKAFPLQKAIG